MRLHIKEAHDRDSWNDQLRRLPKAHILQSWDWGEFKRDTVGWQPTRLIFERDGAVVAMASVGRRRLGPLQVMYVARGPALDYADAALVEAVVGELESLAARSGAVWLKIDPAVTLATGMPGSDDDQENPEGQQIKRLLQRRGWTFSESQVQFRNTVALDLERPEPEILMAMSGNTRRKVRTATKKGVTVREAGLADLATLYALYQETAARDGFIIRPFPYYERAWAAFMRRGLAHGLIAEYAGTPIAHVILFRFGATCWYFYGASANAERQRMPNYLLQWEAIKWAKAQGCARYDLWGAPDVFDESDPLWGVWGFKRGFRGTLSRQLGAWDYAPRPWLYRAYSHLMPRLRRLSRR